ncbi:hypothetical protein [Rhodovulum visakhapatnamense]|uniref:Uncharacterized protein n=1 Tax=Rhodovulum visakhapatnamense TaxID=364297 RepID=A0ABS1RMK9_9RHOB|nr:hypothetical protein [Rhodovulum visakhapatnamense]MBL3570924.1 hypothetical protein [Rhodovulum visakhapatnamense]MBL3580137.1 hypothetical protein [Rhodovulum visakhapatnamense]
MTQDLGEMVVTLSADEVRQIVAAYSDAELLLWSALNVLEIFAVELDQGGALHDPEKGMAVARLAVEALRPKINALKDRLWPIEKRTVNPERTSAGVATAPSGDARRAEAELVE